MCSCFCWFVCEAFLCVHVLAGRVVVAFAAVVDCGFAVVFLDSVGHGLGLGKKNNTYNHCFKRSIKL